MAKRYFTADWHLNSEGTRSVCNRPFKTVEKMNERIIANANNRAKTRSDLIVHVGDFCQRGDDNHYKTDELRVGINTNPSVFLDKISATFVNIEGNHDDNNGVRSIGRNIITKIGNFYDASVGHYPSWYEDARGTYVSHRNQVSWTIRICGHVHGAWKHRIDFENNILNINVGVDVWKYNIVSESDILGYVGHIAKDVTKQIADWRSEHKLKSRIVETRW
jgi:calcineurin-like phosphoesterase family protein